MRGKISKRGWALWGIFGFLGLAAGPALSCSFGPDAKAAAVYSYAARQLAKEKNMEWVVAELGGVNTPAEFEEALAAIAGSLLVEEGTLRSNYQERAVGFVLKRRDPAALTELARDLSAAHPGLLLSRLPDLGGD